MSQSDHPYCEQTDQNIVNYSGQLLPPTSTLIQVRSFPNIKPWLTMLLHFLLLRSMWASAYSAIMTSATCHPSVSIPVSCPMAGRPVPRSSTLMLDDSSGKAATHASSSNIHIPLDRDVKCRSPGCPNLSPGVCEWEITRGYLLSCLTWPCQLIIQKSFAIIYKMLTRHTKSPCKLPNHSTPLCISYLP